LLSTNDVRIAITVSAQNQGWEIVEWLDEKTLKSKETLDYVTLTGPTGTKKKAAVVPDGYFILETETHLYHHFLEIDLATVTGETTEWGKRNFAMKVATYLEYYRSGKYEERYNTQGMRVLTVTTSETRLANLKAITERAGGKQRFWFTTFDLIKESDSLIDPIWQIASREGLYTFTW
jgi:hypothetical protein